MIYLGMPLHSIHGATPAAFHAFERPSRRLQVRAEMLVNSSLVHCFTSLWCGALNLGCEYFAMLHGDVEPQPGWLDVLLGEMDRHTADCISAVAPLKDDRGCTSTAIDDPDNPWLPLRRLTMTDVFDLPETFSAADCGHPDNALLVNTGCFLVRMDALPADFVFEQRVRKVCSGGQWSSQLQPEDWIMSRTLHRLGRRVLATRKVALTHRGDFGYPNDRVWGEPIDRESEAVHANADLSLPAAV